jgi:hypothetical protein
MTDYLPYQESVKMLRDAIKRNFPEVRFSVAKSYQRGTSVRVRYAYGPPVSVVDRIAQRFHGRDFDGMTDSNSYPSALLADAAGNVREVKHGIGFVFVEREIPDTYFAAVVAELGKTWNPAQWSAMQPWDREREAREGLSRIITREGEDLADMARRAVAAKFAPVGVR